MKLNPKIWQPLVTVAIGAVAGYMGYAPIQEQLQPSTLTVNIPEHAPVQKHTHKDWTDAYERADQKLIDEHIEADH